MSKEQSLDEAITGFTEEAVHNRASSRTQDSYGVAVRRFFAVAELTTLAEAKALAEADMPKLIRALERKYKPATVALTVSAARQFYRALRVDDPELVNPLADVQITVPNNVPDWNVLHEGASAELLSKVTDLKDRAVLLCLVMQGWRVSEFCKMTWRHVRESPDGEHVVQWKGKRGKLRNQRLQKTVYEALQALGPPASSDAPLVAAEGKRPYTRFEVYNIVKRCAKKAGFKVTPHGLRATYISSVIARKGIEAARQLGGHESIETTRRYSRWKIDDDDLSLEDL